MKKPLVFEAPPRKKLQDNTMPVRLDTDVIEAVSVIAKKCRLTARFVASECIRYALANVEIREIPLCDMRFPDDE